MKRTLHALVLTFLVAIAPGCGTTESTREETVTRSLADVIRERAPGWMEHEDVVGVYEGRDDAGDPCIKVMVTEISDELRDRLPAEVDGYRLLLHETGPIGPVDDP